MFQIFSQFPKLTMALSQKNDGQMRLMGDLTKDKIALENRKRFFDRLGPEKDNVVCADLIHDNNVAIVGRQNQGMMMVKTDGLITGEKNLFLSLTVADCLPIFLFEKKTGIVGLIHAGWRPLSKNILEKAMAKIEELGGLPGNILVGVGPGIGSCHFEVKGDVAEVFTDFHQTALERKDGKLFLDLKEIAKLQLLRLGLKEANIEVSPECTFCLENSEYDISGNPARYKYFSARRDKPKKIQAMAAIIGLRA